MKKNSSTAHNSTFTRVVCMLLVTVLLCGLGWTGIVASAESMQAGSVVSEQIADNMTEGAVEAAPIPTPEYAGTLTRRDESSSADAPSAPVQQADADGNVYRTFAVSDGVVELKVRGWAPADAVLKMYAVGDTVLNEYLNGTVLTDGRFCSMFELCLENQNGDRIEVTSGNFDIQFALVAAGMSMKDLSVVPVAGTVGELQTAAENHAKIAEEAAAGTVDAAEAANELTAAAGDAAAAEEDKAEAADGNEESGKTEEEPVKDADEKQVEKQIENAETKLTTGITMIADNSAALFQTNGLGVFKIDGVEYDRAAAPLDAGDTERDTYSIVIKYVFTNGNEAANPWTATIAKGSNYSHTVTSPSVVGYTPDLAEVEINITDIQADKTYTVTYRPALVDYTVKHYQQNLDDDNYTLADTETKTGYTESTVGDSLKKSYDGFTGLLYDTTTKIAADGSTVVEIYYDRNYYLLSLNLDGGYGAEPVYARFGAPVSVSDPTKPGYTFAGWNPEIPATMPAGGGTYTAQWTAGNATYLVQYWQENADDIGYSYVESSEPRTAQVGSTVSGSNDKSYSGFTYNSDDTDKNVTVKGDNSTVVNVYYKRNVYEVKFYKDNGWGFISSWKEDTSKRITAKYGAYIGDKWPGGAWYVKKNGSKAQSNLSIMPLGGKEFYDQRTGSRTATATYYVEVLPGESGTTVSGKTYKVHHTDTAKCDSLKDLTVTNEERYEIQGYTCNTNISTKNGKAYDGAKFYYTRNSYDLVFNDNYGRKVSEKLPFEQVLSESVNYKKNYVPAYPTELETGAYVFGGWYLDPEGTREVDWTAKMPAASVVLYAKWVPITHTVSFADTEGTEPYEKEENVAHNDLANKPSRPPENGNYDFVGWFYKDENGVEHAFDLSMAVTRDLVLYAKWSSNKLVEYTIRYTLEDRTTVVAAETKGSALAGSTKTFDAKTGAQLDEGYRSGFFPETSSHSVTMDINGGNEFTFIYVPKEKVNYIVKYLEVGTEKVLHDDKHASTRDAVITEKFEAITGYRPDAYQKRLILSANEEENVLIFWYVKDDKHAPVQVIHWTQNIEGDGYTEYQSSTNLDGIIGQTYSENPLNIPGFTYNADKSNASGELTVAGLVLNLYYDRIEYPYEFRFLERGTTNVLAEPVKGQARYQAQVTQTAKPIEGYTLFNENPQAMTIGIENPANVAKQNVRRFYYEQKTAVINYVAVTTGMGSVSPASETVMMATGLAAGSTPAAKEGYHFVGWYKDEACTTAVDPAWVDSSTNKITPSKAADALWPASSTYYAKFESDNVTLTITKTITGNFGDKGKSFTITVYDENKAVIPADNGAGDQYTNNTTKTYQIPYGKSVTIKETGADDYKMYVNDAETENTSKTIILTVNDTTTDQTVNIRNNKDKEIPMGVSLDSLPYIIVLAAVAVAAVVIILRKRRNNDD